MCEGSHFESFEAGTWGKPADMIVNMGWDGCLQILLIIDHNKIWRLKIQSEHTSIKNHRENFEIINETQQLYIDQDDTGDKIEVKKQENEFYEVGNKKYESWY